MGYIYGGSNKSSGGYIYGNRPGQRQGSRTQAAETEVKNSRARLKAVGEEAKQPRKLLPTILDLLRRPDYATTNLIKEFIPSQRGEKFDPVSAIGRGLSGKERPELKEVLSTAGVSDKPLFSADIMPGKKEVRVSPSPAGILGFLGEAFNPANPINWLTFGTGGALAATAKGAAKEAAGEAVKRGLTAKLANPITGKVAAEGLIPGTAKAGEAFANTVGKRIVESEPYQKLAKSFSTKFIPESVPDKVMAKTLRGSYKGESLEDVLRGGIGQPAGKALGATDFKELPSTPNIIGRIVTPVDKNDLGKITAFNPETQEVTVQFFNNKADKIFSPKQLKVLNVNPEDIKMSQAGDLLNPTIKDVSGKEAFADVRNAREAMEQMARGEIDKVDRELQAAFKGLSLEERKMITKAVGLRSTDELPEKLAPYYKSAVDTLEGYRKWLRGAGILPREIEKYVPFIATGRKLSKEQKVEMVTKFGTGIKQFEGLTDLQEWYAKFIPNIRERTTQSTIPSEVNEFLKKNFFEEDIAEILSTYTSRVIKAQGAKEYFDAVVTKYGLKLEDAKSIKDVPQGYGLYRLKVDPETGQRSFEDVSLQAARSIDKQVGKQTKLADAANTKAQQQVATPGTPGTAGALGTPATSGVPGTPGKEFAMQQNRIDILPKELRGAKPKYGYGNKQFSLEFESDIDKALYIVAQKNKSKADDRYMAFLKAALPKKSEKQIRELGAKVRGEIKNFAKEAGDDTALLPIVKQEKIRGKIEPKVATKTVKFTDEAGQPGTAGQPGVAGQPGTPGQIAPGPAATFTPGEIKIADDILALPAEFAKHINEYTGAFFDPTMQGTLWDYVDKATSIFKTTAYLWNPGHLPRDATSNMFQLWLMGMKDLRRYSDGINILKGDKFTPRGLNLTSEQIMKNARDYGLIGTEMVSADIGKNILSKLTYTKSMGKATRAVDDASRLAGFVDQLAKGLTPEQAAVNVKKYLFDYFELTPFERKWMKRVMPFYTWTRKNLPTQFRELLQQPRKYAQVARAQDYISEDFDQQNVPDWLREGAAMLLPGTPGQRQFTLPNLPYADIATTGKDLVAGTNPLLRVPFELASGRKTFSGAPIDNNIEYAAGQLVPALERIRTMLDTENPRQIARVLSTLGSPTTYDESAASTSALFEERDRLREAIRKLQKQGKNVPTSEQLKPQRRGKRGGYIY